MFMFTDRKGKVVGAFTYYSDSVQFETANKNRGYVRRDLPGLDTEVDRLISADMQQSKATHVYPDSGKAEIPSTN